MAGFRAFFDTIRLALRYVWRHILDWAYRFVQTFRVLFRALGLGILTVVRRRELPKILIYTSGWQVAFHSVTHILPILVSVTIISFNLQGYFIGRELQGWQGRDGLKLAVIQIAAKIQELLIVSSIGSIIFRLLRSQLIIGDGVPLGLLGSGFAFSQASFFWSTEFWGGIVARDPPNSRWTHRIFIITVLIGGLLALMAGPATAVLMIPRVLDWPVGGGVFWLNGSDAQLWPPYIDQGYLADWDCSSNEARLFDTKCPSAGFLPIYQHFYTWWNIPEKHQIQVEFQDYSLRKVIYSTASTDPNIRTSSYTTHSATAVLQDAMRNQYLAALAYLKHRNPYAPPGPNYLDVAESMRFEVETKVPNVRSSCLVNSNVTVVNQTLQMTFSAPWAQQDNDYSSIRYENYVFDVTEATQKYLVNRGILESSASGLAFANNTPTILSVPLVLPQDTTSALGLLILQNIGDVWASTTCAIYSRWETAVSVIESTKDNNRLAHEFWRDRVVAVVRTEIDRDTSSAEIIRIDPSWYELLSPVLADSAIFGEETSSPGPDRSTVERLLEVLLLPRRLPQETGSPSRNFLLLRGGVEHMLATYFVDGLSRCGSQLHPHASQLLGAWEMGDWGIEDGDLAEKMVNQKGPQEVFPLPSILSGGNSTRMVMRTVFTGYVMAAVDWFDYFSIALLLLHAVIASAHTIWAFCHRQTSEAWDSVPELVALSQKSPPPGHGLLANSSAGIRTLRTMGQVAVVEASATQAGEEVHLRFRDPARPRDTSLMPKPQTEYS